MTIIYVALALEGSPTGRTVGFGTAADDLQRKYASQGLDTAQGVLVVLGVDSKTSGSIFKLNGRSPEKIGSIDACTRGRGEAFSALQPNSLVLCAPRYQERLEQHLRGKGYEVVNLSY